MNGVAFGDKHSHTDWGLILSTKTISAPEPQTNLISVPGRNGSVDLSEVLTGNVRYKDRAVSITFYTMKRFDEWTALLSDIENYVQGQKMRIVFDDDPAFYYYGRCKVDSFQCDKSVGKLVISATVDPYKYNITTSAEDWLWDTFDFEQSVINELYDLQIEGERTIDIVGIKKYENPIIISDAVMTVEHNGAAYQIAEGSQVMYDITLTKETETLTFKGNGIISINYTGGSL